MLDRVGFGTAEYSLTQNGVKPSDNGAPDSCVESAQEISGQEPNVADRRTATTGTTRPSTAVYRGAPPQLPAGERLLRLA